MEKKLMVIPPNQMNKSGKERDLKKLRVGGLLPCLHRAGGAVRLPDQSGGYYREYIGEKEEYQLVEIFSDEGISGDRNQKKGRLSKDDLSL